MTTFLVTGGAGFIGSHIVGRLLRDGHRVKVLDNFVAGNIKNLKDVLDDIELIRGDIRDKRLVNKIIKGVDYVLHQAALRSVPKSVKNPLLYNDVNVYGTLMLLMASCRANVKRFIFASSSSVYGDTNELPEKEIQEPRPISPYAVSKLAGECYCKSFNKLFGLEAVCLRYFNVFGPRQSLESQYAVVIPKFITSMLNNEQPPIHGSGRQSRDFTYVDNVVDANIKALTARGATGEVFNIASGKPYTVLSLVDNLNRILGKNIRPKHVAPRPGDVMHTWADISKANRILRCKPEINFIEGLKRTVEWFATQQRYRL